MEKRKREEHVHLEITGDKDWLDDQEDENNEPINQSNYTKETKDNESNVPLLNNEQKDVKNENNSKDNKTISIFNESFIAPKSILKQVNNVKFSIFQNTTNIANISRMRNKDNNQSNNENEKTLNKRYAICPFCSEFANFTIDFNNPEQFWLKCNGCKNNKTISIVDYFNKINNKDVSNTKQIFCQDQNHKENLSYCIICKQYCCPICQSDCKEKHSNHTIINTIKTELFLKKKSLIENIKNIVNIYLNKLRSLIKELEDSFEELKVRNENIFNFLQLNIQTLEKYPQHIVYENYVNNSTWNEEQFIEDKDQLSEFNITNLLKYINQFVFVKSNFDFTKFNIKNTVKKHRDYISCILQLTSKRIASSSFDGTINIYNKDLQFDYSINDHTDNVSSMLELRNNKLVTCSFDKSIKCFKLKEKSFSFINSVDSHKDYIYQLISLPENNFASCSEDKTIIIWDSNVMEKNALAGHSAAVKGMIVTDDNKMILSISDDGNLGKWNNYFDNNVKYDFIPLKNCDFISSIIQIDHNNVMIGCYNQILIVNFRNEGEVKNIINPTYGYIDTIISIRKGIFLLGCYEGILVYDYNTNFNKLYKTNHSKAISALAKIDENCFISGSLDKSIIMWECKETQSNYENINELASFSDTSLNLTFQFLN